MRYAFVLILGIAIGALAMSQVGKILAARDAYPRGVMAVMQQHYGALRRSLDTGACKAADNQNNLAWVARMSTQINPALNPHAADLRFDTYVRKLDARITAAQAIAPNDCPALRMAAQHIGAACSACHEVYR
jgi:cytochrome c556